MTTHRLAIFVLCAALAGCEGKFEFPWSDSPSEANGPPQPAAPAFACAPEAVAPEVPLRRLSRTQYLQSVSDLLTTIAPASSQSILAEVATQLAQLPPDTRQGPDPAYGGLQRLDQAIYQRTVEGSYEVASAIGKALIASDARLTAAAGGCATDTSTANDAACFDDFLRRFGRRALRHPVGDDDLIFYRQLAGTTVEREDYQDLVTVLLSSPAFLYFVEESPQTPPSTARLSAWALASRLSFHFWQTIPDDALLAAAESGALATDEGYRAQVERLYRDPRTEKSLDEFFGDWLDPEHLGELDENLGNPGFDAFRGDFTPTAQTRHHMLEEVLAMGRYYSHDTEASFRDFFTSPRSFARTDDLASLYGVPVWTTGEPPRFPNPEREGVLTRALLLATGTANTRPIMKGVFVRKALLCDKVPAPPADAMSVAATVNTGVTARARVEAVSEARADCSGCHRGLINPLGFLTESFDALGRFRTTEKVYDKASGALIADEPLALTAQPLVTFEDERLATSATELNQFMLESGKPQACFARRYFRFTFGRKEDDARDGCTLGHLQQMLVRGDSLSSVLRELALRPEFVNKTFEP